MWLYLEGAYAILCYAKSLQSCPTLCDPIDGSPPGSIVPGILQARIQEWVAISFSSAWKEKSESEVAQSCPTLSDPMDCSLPGSSVHGIFQARVVEWGAIAFSLEGAYQGVIKMKLSHKSMVLIQQGRDTREVSLHVHTEGRSDNDTGRRRLSASQQEGSSHQKPDQLEPCGKTHFYCLSHPVCGTWSCQPMLRHYFVTCTLILPGKAMMCLSWMGTHSLVLSGVQLCDPMDCSLPGSSVHGILQARILEWVVISSSRASSRPRDQTRVSCGSCFAVDSLPLSHLGSPPRCTIPMTWTCEILKNKDEIQCFW